MVYKKIYLKDIKKEFTIIGKVGRIIELKYQKGINNIKIKIPFILNEDVAKLAGLMPDGSLIKDLKRVYFTQKKDLAKIKLFGKLISTLFSPNNKIFTKKERNGSIDIYTNSMTLAMFLYKKLGFSKSNEEMRIPSWVFVSPKTVKLAYLREAYAMEGTILKSTREIRFITKDRYFAYDIQRLLKQVEIIAHIGTRIGGIKPQTQYRISVYGKENFIKFQQIGFSYKLHKRRFLQKLKDIK